MAINFPDSPQVNDTHTVDGRSWTFNGTTWNISTIGLAGPTGATGATGPGVDGVTASASELNILDGATLTTTELNYVDGVTSSIQTQLSNKQDKVSGVSDTEIGYLDGVTSAIQTQLDAKALKTQTVVDKSSSYSIGSSDGGILIRSTASSGITITVTDQFLAGEQIDVVQYGTGQVTFAAGPGITLVSSGDKFKTAGQYSAVTIKWISDAADVILIGDTAA